MKRFWKKINRSNFFIKLRSWEYWPFGIIQLPFFLYWFWLSLKARSFLFFSASNPSIPTGGMMGESKFDVLTKIPTNYKPASVLIKQGSAIEQVLVAMEKAQLNFPVIFKPDVGERGWRVTKINNTEEAIDYLRESPCDFIVQALVDLPLEFGVFYRRFPSEQNGVVTSVVMKEMLSVEGDGSSTLRELILRKDRAKLQWARLKNIYQNRLEEVLLKGYKLELVSIGNHCLGTTFLDRTDLINDKLSISFDQISKKIEGFYFGRFDLRVAGIDDLYDGKIMVLELNGCGAEPAHIYQPGYSLWAALKVMGRHWKEMYRVSKENHLKGTSYMSLKEGWMLYKNFKKVTQAK